MKMTGTRICSALRRACRSRPDVPGMQTSAIRHEQECCAPEARDSFADANARASNPALWSRPWTASRAIWLSSTMTTSADCWGAMSEYRRPSSDRQLFLGVTSPRLDPGSHPDQLGEGGGLHLPHDPAAMDLDRDLARSQLRG